MMKSNLSARLRTDQPSGIQKIRAAALRLFARVGSCVAYLKFFTVKIRRRVNLFEEVYR